MRDISERSMTEGTIETFDGAENPRARQILQTMVRRRHDFVREVEASDAE